MSADSVISNILDDEFLLLEILRYCNVPTLVAKKSTSRKWKLMCNSAIHLKLPPTGRKKFKDGYTLKRAVQKYNRNKCNDAEELARTYGWPIGTWDVSEVELFINTFADQHTFNEDISSWDTSSAIKMHFMFRNAYKFNQDISSWNTSNVRDMSNMFSNAWDFNGDISSWDTSRLENSHFMFRNSSFNRDITSWDLSRIKHVFGMFEGTFPNFKNSFYVIWCSMTNVDNNE